MPQNPHSDTRYLSIEELVGLWFPERPGRLPKSNLTRELQLFFLNIADGRDWKTEGLVQNPDFENLPKLTEVFSKGRVREFCIKKHLPLPRFWFQDEVPAIKPRGRPSDMPAIVQELERRAEAGELEDTVTDEARVLVEWAVGQRHKRVQFETIRRNISARYKKLKNPTG